LQDSGKTPFPQVWLANVVTLAGDAIIAIDGAQRVVLFNHAAERLFDCSATELLGGPLDPILPERFRGAHAGYIRNFLDSGMQARLMGERSEIVGLRKNGTEFPAEATISRQDVPGAVFLTAIVRDISQRKREEQVLEAALTEKDLLLKELRHRINNNMQVIESLLNLQIKRITDPEARSGLRDLHSRIQALHLMYRALGETVDRVPAAAYVRNMIAHLQSFFTKPESPVAITVDAAEDILLPSRQATYFGMLVNEIVTKSFKHAFPDGRNGRIRIRIRRTADERIELTVTDNGVGVPDEMRNDGPRSGLGLRLIDGMVGSLGGRMIVEHAPGMRYRIEWPVPAVPGPRGPAQRS
jgi:PAS domain S-box-containing protein